MPFWSRKPRETPEEARKRFSREQEAIRQQAERENDEAWKVLPSIIEFNPNDDRHQRFIRAVIGTIRRTFVGQTGYGESNSCTTYSQGDFHASFWSSGSFSIAYKSDTVIRYNRQEGFLRVRLGKWCDELRRLDLAARASRQETERRLVKEQADRFKRID